MELPPEIISKVLDHLAPADRLSAGLCCKLWRSVLLRDKFWSDIVVVATDSIRQLTQTMKRTENPIQNLVLKNVSFSDDSVLNLFHHLGPSIVLLEFNNCYLTDKSLLQIISSCMKLKTLIFNDCRDTFLNGKILNNRLIVNQTRARVPNLSHLTLTNNSSYISDALVDDLIYLFPHLKSLNLANNSISYHPGIRARYYPMTANEKKPSELVLTYQTVLEHISSHSVTFRGLDLSRTSFNDKDATSLSRIKDLQLHRLMLQGVGLGSAGLSLLCRSQQKLIELDLSSCLQITDAAVIALCAALPKLQSLSLMNCRCITDTGVASLASLIHLRSVNLQGLQLVTAEGVQKGILFRRTHLQQLNLGSVNITAATIPQLGRTLTNLRRLDLTYCVSAVTDTSFEKVWPYFRRLTDLRLDWCRALSNEGIGVRLPQSFLHANATPQEKTPTEQSMGITILKDLVHLSLVGCSQLSDSAFLALRFNALRYLNLASCFKLSDVAFTSISHWNPSLEELVVSRCVELTDEATAKSVRRLRRLRRLNLQECTSIGNATMNALQNSAAPLRLLNVSHCPLITTESIYHLKLLSPLLSVLA